MEFNVKEFKFNYLLDKAMMEGKQRKDVPLLLDSNKIDLEPYRKLKEISKDIKNYVNNGKNILIYSKFTGNGKTEWSKKLLFSWFKAIAMETPLECRGLFVSLPRLINAMKSNITKPDDYYNYINEHIRDVDVVVWDELNYKDLSNNKSTFEHDYLLDIISYRHSIGKTNIYTSNYDLDTMAASLGTRLSSRIIGESIQIEFKGNDKRGWGE